MASFTDQISKFNPYVQQLPIEAMVQVGMEKQKRYDEGLQKIQTNIDNIAGLDVIRDVDKLYLQSKLNQLGSNLKSIAAGDFSNFQLVNSVGGMASQIVRDPNVVNALSSTKAYRKGIEDMNALVKEGKGSASRTWEFKTKANEWLNSTELSERFDSTYKPYTNYRKNATEVIKGLTGDSTIRDDAFDIDASGNLVIKDAMTRRKLAGISPEKIQQALLVGLSPDDWEQMSVDGRYNYSNTTAESFANSVGASYKSKYDAFAQQKTILENAKSSTPSAVEKTKIDQKIEELDRMLKNVQEEYNSVSKTFEEGDVESAKARLFTTNFMSGFSRAFSYTETSDTYETSPFAQAQQWRETKAQEWQKFTMEFGQRERFHTDTMRREDEKIRLEALAQQGYGGFPTSVDPNDVPKIAIDKVIAQTNAIKTQVDNQDAAFMKSQGKDKAWLDQQRVAWLKSPNGVDPLIAQHFNQTEGARSTALENEVMVGKINAEADRIYGDVYKNIPKNAPNLTYTDGKGTKYVYTPRDLVDFNTKISSYQAQTTSQKRTSVGGPVYESVWLDSKAKEELSPKELVLYNAYTKGGKNMTSADGAILNNLANYAKTVNIPYGETLRKKQDWIGNEVKRRVTGFQGMEYTIPTTTKVQQESLANIFTSVANLAESQKGKIANSPNLDVTMLRTIAQSGNPQAVIKVVEGTEFSPAMYEVTATGAAGTTKFKITPEQKNAIFGNRFEASPAVQAFRPYQNMMRKYSTEGSPYLSTNPENGPTNVSNAALGPTTFSNVKSYGVSGNIVSGDGGVTYSIRLNIYDPNIKKLYEDIPYPRLLLEGEVANTLKGLTDASVYEILNDNKKSATKPELQKLQNTSKNPL
jgi:hypothetical protein